MRIGVVASFFSETIADWNAGYVPASEKDMDIWGYFAKEVDRAGASVFVGIWNDYPEGNQPAEVYKPLGELDIWQGFSDPIC